MRQMITRELMLLLRKKSDLLNPLVFYLLVISLFPLGVGPELKLLSRIAPGVIWVAVLLALMLSLERMFRDEYRDGSLEQWLLAPAEPLLLVLGKIFAQWLLICLPMVFVSPIAGLLMGMSSAAVIATVLTLLLATPCLLLLGALGAALTVNVARSGILHSLLVLPLYVPILIYSSSAIDAAELGLNYIGQLALLAAASVLALSLLPFAIVASLRISVD